MQPRSYLFVPGDSERKLAKLASSGADAAIICLEDAVVEQNKALARKLTAAYLCEHRNDSAVELWVRVNAFDTEHLLDDLVAVMPHAPVGLFLPKPSSREDLVTFDHYLTVLERVNQFQDGSTRVMTLAESATGTLSQAAFVGVSPRYSAYTWGAEDMAADLGALTNTDIAGRHFLVHRINRANCLTVSAAANMQAVDGICSDFKNPDVLQSECDLARAEGFTGKLAIHPAQVPIINKSFTPSEQELDWARRVVDCFERSDRAGAVALDGKMLDRPHLNLARELLARRQTS